MTPELIILIEAIVTLINKYGATGIVVFILAILVWKGKPIFTWIDEKILSNWFPLWHMRRKQTLDLERQKIQSLQDEKTRRNEEIREQREYQRMLREKDQLDTVLILKEMLLEYRKRIDDNEVTMNSLQNRQFETVANYEKLATQVISVLRDISQVIRALTDRIDRMSTADK